MCVYIYLYTMYVYAYIYIYREIYIFYIIYYIILYIHIHTHREMCKHIHINTQGKKGAGNFRRKTETPKNRHLKTEKSKIKIHWMSSFIIN